MDIQRIQHIACEHCQTSITTQWRSGPSGKGTLCNACGLKFAKGTLSTVLGAASREETTFHLKGSVTCSVCTKEISLAGHGDSGCPRWTCTEDYWRGK